YDLTPIGFALSGVVIMFSVFYDGLIDIVPVARDNLVEKIDTGIAVVDNDGKIIDINSATKEMLGLEDDELIGEPVDEILADFPRIREIYDEITPVEEDFETEFSITDPDDGELRHYQVLVSPLYDNRGKRVGQSFVINDITKQKWREEELKEREHELEQQKDELEAQKGEQKQKLEHQNERLDEFASIVSHDLRNPLNVAEGYIDMLAEDIERKEVDEVSDALDRMENIIDDSLTLARQ
ncbi:MAG: PAS domain S-box protein, partial [Halobacteria archaeon]|nr:PAS domain S-box protein [Halobacteria archaeon]